MSRFHIWNRSAAGKFFPLPNALFHLELSAGEIAVYAYLMYRENRKTYQCYPSYKIIGKAVNLSPNTVRKHVRGLEEKNLIYTEPTSVMTRNGEKRNGSLLYTIRPIQDAVELLQTRLTDENEKEFAKLKQTQRLIV